MEVTNPKAVHEKELDACLLPQSMHQTIQHTGESGQENKGGVEREGKNKGGVERVF